MPKLVCHFSVILAILHCVLGTDNFKEELFVKPLESGHVYFQFQFTTIWNADLRVPETFQHYRLFPKPLGEVLTAYNVQELHLSLTQGVWRYDKWGYQMFDAPPGAELWVWFQENTQNVEQTWAELNNALSGLFCASLNFMDTKSTTVPQWSFRPTGLVSQESAPNSKFLRYSALPREIVCTENLTPWKKLLPCDSKVGLSTLFNAIKLYDASYHSLGIHVRPVCADVACTAPAIELTQTLAVVFDGSGDSGGRNPGWHLKKLFSRTLSTQCPLAHLSKVYVDLSNNKTGGNRFKLTPAHDKQEEIIQNGKSLQFAVYYAGKETEGGKQFNLALNYLEPLTYEKIQPPPLYAHRFIAGSGLEKGGITCHLYNHLSTDLSVIYLETVPWFVRLYFNTLTIETNNTTTVKPRKVHYVPGRDRERLYTLEILLTLQANSVTSISFEFDRAFLKWTEYPPDANHGFYVNAAVISALIPEKKMEKNSESNEGRPSYFLRIHTESLLLMLPTPDFSMPYNVICLACTVIAIAFGSLHNLTTRRFQIVDPRKKKGLKEKVKNFIRIFRKKNANTEMSESESDIKVEDIKNSENDSAKNELNIDSKKKNETVVEDKKSL